MGLDIKTKLSTVAITHVGNLEGLRKQAADSILAEFDRLTEIERDWYRDHGLWVKERGEAKAENERLKAELEETEYRLMNWQQTAEAHANCAESQGKKVAALQSWLDKISEPMLEYSRRFPTPAMKTVTGLMRKEHGGSFDTPFGKNVGQTLNALAAYLDSQEPSKKSWPYHICQQGLYEGGTREDCPTCNPSEVLHIMEQVYGKPKFILFGDKKPPEWEQSPQDINLVHKYFYEK